MYPELFEIPFIHRPIHSFGLMMVIGFLAAIFLIRRIGRNIIPDPQLITNASLYSLIAGVAGARLFFVVHHFDKLDGGLLSLVAVWRGGLEFYGGVAFALAVIVLYLWHHKLPIRRCLDILAIGLMLGLAFGRIGCFLNGCCFGKPTKLPWGVRFPYGSYVYRSQVDPDPQRDRRQARIELPVDFFTYYPGISSTRILKPYADLTETQKKVLKETDKYRSLPVHPTQLYSSANGAVLCLVLYLLWRRSRYTGSIRNASRFFTKPGYTFSLAFIFYGITRFYIECLRDDNPFEVAGLTISQIISVPLIVAGVVLIAIFHRMKPEESGR
jgi:phosphatidylglycerol:prolipoprotein diacylglycerol transferase